MQQVVLIVLCEFSTNIRCQIKLAVYHTLCSRIKLNIRCDIKMKLRHLLGNLAQASLPPSSWTYKPMGCRQAV
jgi:hypothetical protein